MDFPEKLLEILNEDILSYKNVYCQTVLLTANDWGDVLGVAYQDNPNSRLLFNKYYKILAQANLCNSPSSFVLTAKMKGNFINQATLAYLFAHESAHTLCADVINK